MIWRNEEGYLGALAWLMTNGVNKGDRTGTGTRSKFGFINLEFDLMDGDDMIVPKLSTKEILDEKVRGELGWMMSGSTRLEPLINQDIHIWDNWVLPGSEILGTNLLTWKQRMKLLTKEQNKLLDSLWFIEDLDPCVTREGPLELGQFDKAKAARLHVLFDSWGVRKYNLLGGELGPVYGKQWRQWNDTRYITVEEYQADMDGLLSRGFKVIDKNFQNTHVVIQRTIDQIAEIENALRTDKDSRRMILNAWNVSHIDEMALPPCHTLIQWGVEQDYKGNDVLSCKLYQRSIH